MRVFSFSRNLKGQREKNEIPNLFDKRSPTESFFFLFPLTPPRGTRRTLPTQRPIGPRPIFPFFLYATSWHRAEGPDILPNRSPTDFFFLTPHRGTEQRSPTHCSNGPRPTFVFFSFLFLRHLVAHFPFCFFTPPRSTEQKFWTHC